MRGSPVNGAGKNLTYRQPDINAGPRRCAPEDKFEIRNPQTNSKSEARNLASSRFRIWCYEFVSDFVLRISDFGEAAGCASPPSCNRACGGLAPGRKSF